jgi:isopenicillin N synthase-like dioxygenase
MAYASAKQIDVSEIPVIDISGLMDDAPGALESVAAEMRQAAERVGFFYIRGHGVPKQLIEDVLETARRFFAHPEEAKNAVKATGYHRGFLAPGQAKMYGGKRPDLKESFVWGRDVAADDPTFLAGDMMVVPNRWPDAEPGMKPLFDHYFDVASDVGARLLRAFAVSLGVEQDYFLKAYDKPISRASIIHYPSQPPELGEEQFGVAPHTDYGTITLLYQDDVGGLQVQGRDGDWVTAHPIEDTFVVNVGDLLARWTNDRFKSTPHRVINASGRERYSFGFFVDPNVDCQIDPVVVDGETTKYQPVTCGDYIRMRLDQSMQYRKEEAGKTD